jgi:OPA family sugar phosphate sensor protein UhpC-like MFS transporter
MIEFRVSGARAPAAELSLPGTARPASRLQIFWITWLAYAGFYLCRKNFSVVMPFLQDEAGIGKTALAGIIFGYSLCYALGQFLTGSLASRYSPRAVVTAGLILAAAANLGMPANPTHTLLLGLGMLNGLAQSSGWPGLLKTMAAWFEPRERGVVMGWWTTNYVLGGFLATVFASWLVSGGDWRQGFVMPALALLAVAAVFALCVRDRPEETAPSESGDHRRSFAGYGTVIRQPVAWVTALTAFLVKVTRYSFLFWLPLYLSEHLHYRPDQAGYLSSVYELAGIGGALFAGFMSARVAGSRRYPVVSLMLGGLAVACLVHTGLARMGWTGSLAAISLIGFMTYGPDTLLQGAASQDAGGSEGAAAAAGLVNGVASLGQLVSPYLVALVATRWGWDALFSCFVAVAVAGAALSALFWNMRPPEPDGRVEGK